MTNALIHTPQDCLRTEAGIFTRGANSANAGTSETFQFALRLHHAGVCTFAFRVKMLGFE